MSSHGPRHWLRWIIAGVVFVAVLAVVGPYVFIHFIEGKRAAPLILKSSPGAAPSRSGAGRATLAVPVAGTWTIGSGSEVGYRVKEVLAGQSQTAVDRKSVV